MHLKCATPKKCSFRKLTVNYKIGGIRIFKWQSENAMLQRFTAPTIKHHMNLSAFPSFTPHSFSRPIPITTKQIESITKPIFLYRNMKTRGAVFFFFCRYYLRFWFVCIEIRSIQSDTLPGKRQPWEPKEHVCKYKAAFLSSIRLSLRAMWFFSGKNATMNYC